MLLLNCLRNVLEFLFFKKENLTKKCSFKNPFFANFRSSLFYSTSVRHQRHECDTKDTRATRVRNFDFDNDTNENIFLHPYVSFIANERLQREEHFRSKNYLLEMPCSHVKMHLKSAPQKLNFVMTKAISKRYTLDCSCKSTCTFPHSYAQ